MSGWQRLTESCCCSELQAKDLERLEGIFTPGRLNTSSWQRLTVSCCRSELRAKDLERLEGMFADARAREKKKATKEVKEELETLGKIKDWLESGNDVRCCLLCLLWHRPHCMYHIIAGLDCTSACHVWAGLPLSGTDGQKLPSSCGSYDQTAAAPAGTSGKCG